MIAGLCFGSMLARAQTQSVEEVVSAAQSLAVAEPAVQKTVPVYSSTNSGPPGTYWSLQVSHQPPLPFDPFPELPVYPLGNGNYAIDDRSVDFPGLAAQLSAGMPMDLGGPPAPGGSGGYGGGTPLYEIPTFTSNQLWLQITSVTNQTASLIIHPPWNVTNGVYDLLYSTNLATPTTSWQWLLRTEAGQTNLVIPNATDAQGFYWIGPPNDLAANDSLGTNFWIAFAGVVNNYANPSLYISSPVGASGTVILPGLGITNTFSVAAGMVTNISIDARIMTEDYDVVETNGIQIIASQPVSVYGMNNYYPVSAAFTGYPTTLLGTNYCVMARPSYIENGEVGCSELAILGSADSTTVWITPSTNAALLNHGTNAYSINLNKGQTYQINSTNSTNDVTGTLVASDQPIAIFAGANNAYVPDANTLSGNPLVQQQLPVGSWGTQALALSFAGRTNGDSFRVLAACSNTVVTIRGIVVTVDESTYPYTATTNYEVLVLTNQAGQFYDIILEGPVEFQGSQPIQVAHFGNGSKFDNHVFADPCEILLPPTGHYLETNTIFSLTGDFYENYANIIVPQSATNSTTLDGSLLAATNFVAIGGSGYYGARLTLTNSGAHTVISSTPIGIEVYGWGPTDAYGYFGGIVK